MAKELMYFKRVFNEKIYTPAINTRTHSVLCYGYYVSLFPKNKDKQKREPHIS